jgi:putative flippase GtrA
VNVKRLWDHASTLGRASVASVIGTAAEFALLPLLVHVAHVAWWLSFLLVQFVANAITFVLYKYWAFQSARVGDIRVQYAKQLVIFGGSLGLNTVLPSLLSYRLHVEPVLSFAISNVVVYLAWNYPGNRYWVFRRDS